MYLWQNSFRNELRQTCARLKQPGFMVTIVLNLCIYVGVLLTCSFGETELWPAGGELCPAGGELCQVGGLGT